MSIADHDDEREADQDPPAASGGPIAYVGTVVRWSPDSGTGVLRTGSGRELDFDVEHTVVLGELVAGPRAFAISDGQEVGYDVGWTSRGLRVTKLFPAA